MIKVALDWTPNTNHTGFFVADELGYFKEEGISVELVSPAEDNYQTTPAKKLEQGDVDLALAPLESVISYRTKSNPFQVKAIATLLQNDISAIVTLEKSGIQRPNGLDGKIYASYKARYEDEIVKQMIQNDGGKGALKIDYPEKLGIWDTLLEDKADATWVFMNWEGLAAQKADIKLNAMYLSEFNVPYGYSPVIMASEDHIHKKEEELKSFLKAAKKGFLYASSNPKESVELMQKYIPKPDQEAIDLQISQQYTNQFYGDATNWGQMESSRVNNFINWLNENQLETEITSAEELIDNSLLPQ